MRRQDIAPEAWDSINFNAPWFEDFWSQSDLKVYLDEGMEQKFRGLVRSEAVEVIARQELENQCWDFLNAGWEVYSQHFVLCQIKEAHKTFILCSILNSTMDQDLLNNASKEHFKKCTANLLANKAAGAGSVGYFNRYISTEIAEKSKKGIGISDAAERDASLWVSLYEAHVIDKQMSNMRSESAVEPMSKEEAKRM